MKGLKKKLLVFLSTVLVGVLAVTAVINLSEKNDGLISAKSDKVTTATVSTLSELQAQIANEDIETIVVSTTITLPNGTTLDGKGKNIQVTTPYINEMGVVNSSGYSSYSVFSVPNNATVSISNMVVSGGYTTGESDTSDSGGNRSGGIKIGGSCNVTMENVTVTRSCRAVSIYTNSYVVMKNCNIVRNVCYYAGGILVNGCTLVMDGCSLSENRTTSSGGGGGAMEIRNNGYLYANNTVICNNASGERGGAINCFKGNVYIMNCTVTGNITTNALHMGGGFGLWLRRGTSGDGYITNYAEAVNCLFAYNYYYNQSSKTFTSSDIGVDVGNTLKLTNCLYGAARNNGSSTSFTATNCKSGDDAVTNVFGSFRDDGVLLSKSGKTNGFAHPIMTARADSKYALYAPSYYVEGDTSVTYPVVSGGATTYFDYSDMSNIKASYKGPEAGAVETSLGGKALGGTQVTTYMEGTNRVQGVFGASATTDKIYYTVVLDYNFAVTTTNGTVLGATIYGDSYVSGTDVSVIAVPKKGCIVTGWMVNGVLKEVDLNNYSTKYTYTGLDKNITIYPIFEKAITVNFYDYYGEQLSSKYCVEGDNFEVPDYEIKSGSDGYLTFDRFLGWYCKENGVTYSTAQVKQMISGTTFSSDVSFIASYEVTYLKGLVFDVDIVEDSIIVDSSSSDTYTVTATYKVVSNDGINSILLLPKYDHSAFTLTSVVVNETTCLGSATITNEMFDQDGNTKIALESQYIYEVIGDTFVTFNYEVNKANAVDGTYDFGLVLDYESIPLTHNDRSEAYVYCDYYDINGDLRGKQAEVEIKVIEDSIKLVFVHDGQIDILTPQSFVYVKQAAVAKQVDSVNSYQPVGTEIIYSYNGPSTNLTIKWYDKDGNELPSAPVVVGEYYLGISASATPTVRGVSEQRIKFTITPAPITVTIDSKSSEYTMSIVSPLTGSVTSGTVYSGDELNLSYSTTATSLSPVGNYAITGSWINTNYFVTFVEGVYTINKLSVVVKALDQAAEYTGYEPDVDQTQYALYYGYDDSIALPATLKADISGITITKAPGVNVGTYALTPSAAVGANFTFSYKNGIFTITSQNRLANEVLAFFDGDELVYNAQYQDLLISTCVADDGDNTTISLSEFVYQHHSINQWNDNGTMRNMNIQIDAGTYSIVITVSFTEVDVKNYAGNVPVVFSGSTFANGINYYEVKTAGTFDAGKTYYTLKSGTYSEFDGYYTIAKTTTVSDEVGYYLTKNLDGSYTTVPQGTIISFDDADYYHATKSTDTTPVAGKSYFSYTPTNKSYKKISSFDTFYEIDVDTPTTDAAPVNGKSYCVLDQDIVVSVTGKIIPAEVTITAEDKTSVWGSSIKELTYTVAQGSNNTITGAIAARDNVSNALTNLIDSNINTYKRENVSGNLVDTLYDMSSITPDVGTYPIKFDSANINHNNYTFTLVEGTYEVTKAHITDKDEDDVPDDVYDEETDGIQIDLSALDVDYKIDTTITSNAVAGKTQIPAADISLQYSADGVTYYDSLTAPELLNAYSSLDSGEYFVKISIVDTDNHDAAEKITKFTVSPVEVQYELNYDTTYQVSWLAPTLDENSNAIDSGISFKYAIFNNKTKLSSEANYYNADGSAKDPAVTTMAYADGFDSLVFTPKTVTDDENLYVLSFMPSDDTNYLVTKTNLKRVYSVSYVDYVSFHEGRTDNPTVTLTKDSSAVDYWTGLYTGTNQGCEHVEYVFTNQEVADPCDTMTFSLNGYSWAGWDSAKEKDTFTAVTFGYKVSADTVFYANWTRVAYTIEWYNYDGNKITSTSVYLGEQIFYTNAAGLPTRATDTSYAYSFAGWGQIYDMPLIVNQVSGKTTFDLGDNTYTISGVGSNEFPYRIKDLDDVVIEASGSLFRLNDQEYIISGQGTAEKPYVVKYIDTTALLTLSSAESPTWTYNETASSNAKYYAIFAISAKSYKLRYFVTSYEDGMLEQYGDDVLVYYNAVIDYETLAAPTWFRADTWYLDSTLKIAAPTTMPAEDLDVYGAYAFDIGLGDVNADGLVNVNDITLYRRWIVGGYEMIVVPEGTEWEYVNSNTFDATKTHFLMRTADVNTDLSRDIRDVSTIRMAMVGGYNWLILTGVNVTGQEVGVDNGYVEVSDLKALSAALNNGYRVKLMADITNTSNRGNLQVVTSGHAILDMNGHTLNLNSFYIRSTGEGAIVSVIGGDSGSNIITSDGTTIQSINGITNIDNVTVIDAQGEINIGASSQGLNINNVFAAYKGSADSPVKSPVNVLPNTHIIINDESKIYSDVLNILADAGVTGNKIRVDVGSDAMSNGFVTVNGNVEVLAKGNYTKVKVSDATTQSITYLVSTASELENCFATGGKAKLLNDITLQYVVDLDNDLEIDLNGYYLLINNGYNANGNDLTFKGDGINANRSIMNTLNNNKLALVMSDITANSTSPSYDMAKAGITDAEIRSMGNGIVYDYNLHQFVLASVVQEGQEYKYWKFYDEVPDYSNQDYSIYMLQGATYTGTTIRIKVGFEAGLNTVSNINYDRSTATEAHSTLIHFNGDTLVVNAPLDTVNYSHSSVAQVTYNGVNQ